VSSLKDDFRRRGRARRWSAILAVAVVSALFSTCGALAQEPAPEKKKPEEKPAPTEKKTQPAEPLKLENPPPAQQEKPKNPPPPGPLKLENPQAPPTKTEKPKAETPSAPPVIEDILFRGNRRIPASTLRARIFTHAGDPYDENALERDFMALWNTGYLDDIRFEVTDGEKGKILTIFVREKKLVRSIDYKGLSTVAQSDVLDRFREQKVNLTILSQYDPVVVKRAEVVLEGMLAEHGRQFATVRARTRNIPPNSVALTFIVVEGPKVEVGRISFRGNHVISSARLVRAMKLSRPNGAPPWFYWLHKTYDKDKVQYDLEKVRELYQERGYYFALPKDPVVKMVDTKRRWPFFFFSWGRGKAVNLTIPVEEGEQYRMGRLLIRGNKLVKQEQLAPILGLKTGDVFNLSKVRKGMENYTKLYGQFGYINFTANPNIDPDRKRHIINLTLDFEEDKQFLVHRIEFSGNTKTRDKVIRRQLLLDEGNLFNTTFWDYSILRVNQLGFFDEVKKEDYEIRQNPKDNTVDILLKVKEKGRNSIGFQGGISGYAGNFIGLNYSTNNFLGLGETLSINAEWGTFQKSYTFGFTEPYFHDKAVTTGFTVFYSNFKYDQLRQTALLTGINPALLQTSPYAQFSQNFQQNSAGFTAFASYPLRRSFASVGLSYSLSVSSITTFNTASQAFFQALNFSGLKGPNSLSGIVSSQVTPTYQFNTVDNPYNPHTGKYISAGVQFSGSVLGGNVNTIRPVFEFKYFHPINNRRDTVGFHVLASTVSGFGGRVAPPFERAYIGGEYDIRGFDIRSVSPIAFYPTIGQVCNRDNLGNPILATGPNGQPIPGSCGSSTQFPYNTIIFPGGDTSIVTNTEYRIPIVGPVSLALFVDAGMDFAWLGNQLQIQPAALSNITSQFPGFPTPGQIRPISGTNYKPRGSTGIEIGGLMPIVNAPLRIYYGYNFMRLNTIVTPPQNLPALTLFPNQFTYDQVLPFFGPLRLRERKGLVSFTVGRTF
jgi:outer membrane protein insertion porin family